MQLPRLVVICFENRGRPIEEAFTISSQKGCHYEIRGTLEKVRQNPNPKGRTTTKNTIVSILQQRMDKQTSEQFWAVTALTGMNAFVMSQQEKIIAVLPSWAVFRAITFATGYGVYYLIDRHKRYYFYRAELANLLQDEQDVPDFLKTCPDTLKGRSLVGIIFYVSWILGMWLPSLIVYL
ncbi:MAG: hypothetical protein CO103_07510 [Chloroflexi bacterium CG_4_9_14_3_um_filter_45_9]|nr:MAG: hypothetical protein AUK00_02385 [Dehalococcoidia bacterium CG2_30_46_9]PIU23260.1 MAG: hypothetical protein COT13_03980 [Chloroflexi bacterium CG08_land_8_20_14_0_20_45_12]PIX26817.1 MAG: hypothetical protein COZ67_05495 [Chloroflexi bacterium CG_4_8_14_3_um_filter_45_15]PJB48290.1 MAG: hypothetical protein CO103_07510 [Chloroflexi bacterium CG_4_9_14_3_um_filter_45_9]